MKKVLAGLLVVSVVLILVGVAQGKYIQPYQPPYRNGVDLEVAKITYAGYQPPTYNYYIHDNNGPVYVTQALYDERGWYDYDYGEGYYTWFNVNSGEDTNIEQYNNGDDNSDDGNSGSGEDEEDNNEGGE